LNLDFNPALQVPLKNIIADIAIFQEKMEMTGFFERAVFIMQRISELPDFFEKHYLLGTVDFLAENLRQALKYFQTAEKYVLTGKHQLLVWLAYAQIYTKFDPSKMKLYIDKALKQR